MKDKGLVIGMLCAAIVVMAAAYAAFSTSLEVTGTTTIASTWAVAFDEENSSCTDGSNVIVTNGATVATLGVALETPGESVTCTIAVKNSGTLDAYLKTISVTPTGDAPITFTVEPTTAELATRDTLAANGGVEYIKVTATYDTDTDTQPENIENKVTVVANYAQKMNNN